MPAALCAVVADGPALAGAFRKLLHRRQLHFLHHRAQAAVHQYQYGAAVALGVLGGLVDDVHGLLYGVGREHQHTEAAVAGGLGGLQVILLGGLDGAEAGAAALHVHDHRRQLGGGEVGYALALEADAGAGGAGHRPHAGAGGAVDHVYGGHFALALDEHAADFRQAPGEILRQLGLGRDWIAGEKAHARADGGLADGLVALHEYLGHAQPSSFQISIAASGQTTAQVPQPMQSAWSMTG